MGIFGRVDARALGFNTAYFQLARARGEPQHWCRLATPIGTVVVSGSHWSPAQAPVIEVSGNVMHNWNL